MMGNFKEDLMAARFKLSIMAPYYSRVAYAVKFVETPGLGTLAVDEHWRLYYDPELDKPRKMEDGTTRAPWTIDELTGVFAHEMNHLLRMHTLRKPQEATPIAWNICGDAEINDDLADDGFKLPDGLVMPDQIPGAKKHQTAEEYFDLLKKQAEKQSKDGNSSKPGDGIPVTNCGSGAHGEHGDYEESAPTDGDSGNGLNQTEQDLVRRQVAKDMKEHKKSTGRLPAGLDRWADEILGASVDWRREIGALIRNAVARARGKVDYTYSKPNFRRGWSMEAGKNYIQPGTYQPVPNIAVVVDTSGSISGKELTQAVAEINGIIQSLGAAEGVTVISCDAAVQSVGKVYDARQIAKFKGGGGTDMGKGIAYADEIKAQVCVVITDGYTPWPKAAPRCKVIVGVMGNNGRHEVPEWAKYVKVEL